MKIGVLSLFAFFIWAVSEVFIIIRTKLLRHNISTNRLKDKGSYILIKIGLYAGIVICFLFHSQKWGWVKSGPYKVIRHPAYTGTLLTFVFGGIAFNSWISSCIILFVLSAIFVYRIKIEEEVLLSHFQSGYKEYSQNTWRLIPFLW